MSRFAGTNDLLGAITGRAEDVGGPAVAIAQFDHGVFLATVEGDSVSWCPSARDIDPANLLDIRLFGPSGEWHIWRYADDSDEFGERFRDDSGDWYDEVQALWGTDIEQTADGDWLRIFESRGISYELPVAVMGQPGRDILPQLRVRHYYKNDSDDDDAIGLARVVDSRLVSLQWGKA